MLDKEHGINSFFLVLWWQLGVTSAVTVLGYFPVSTLLSMSLLLHCLADYNATLVIILAPLIPL